ncbi:MAG TPA: hypothetical protein VKH37_11985, partial [Ferruginibacter sp.]|nr:hypothetical protein [Ferruginibacter sp.]
MLLIGAVACTNNSNNSNNNSATNNNGGSGSGDTAFQQLSDKFIKGYLGWRPQAAVALGFHEYDGQVTDFSKASLDSELKRLKDFDHQLASFDTASL